MSAGATSGRAGGGKRAKSAEPALFARDTSKNANADSAPAFFASDTSKKTRLLRESERSTGARVIGEGMANHTGN